MLGKAWVEEGTTRTRFVSMRAITRGGREEWGAREELMGEETRGRLFCQCSVGVAQAENLGRM